MEKVGFFCSGFKGFRKQKYMQIFGLSEGVVLPNDRLFKQKYSLFSPELVLYSEKKSSLFYNHAEIDSYFET